MNGIYVNAYEDELCYSVFGRFFVRSGYLSYRSVAEDLFVNSKVRANMELCNLLTNNVQEQIGSMESFVLEHTMFNYYRAFLSPEKQSAVWEMAMAMDIKQLSNALPVAKSKYTRHLRYCTECVKEDRLQHGETYWHRAHQLYGISACYKHGCKLIDSVIEISSAGPPMLVTAEESVDDLLSSAEAAKDIEVRLANYANAVLQSSVRSCSSIGDYLHCWLHGSVYLSIRGAKRHIAALTDDFCEYYKDLDLLGFGQSWQIEKVFSNQRVNSFEICLLGMFLGISPDGLVGREVMYKSGLTGEFDQKVIQLNQQGLSYRQISEAMGISYDYCKSIGNGTRGKYHYSSKKQGAGRKQNNWQELDRQLLPQVKKLVGEMNQLNDTRPQKVSIGRIERLLGLKESQLSKLEKCTSYVREHEITQEEFWALTLAWAITKLRREQRAIHLTNIYKLTNIRKLHIERSTKYLDKYMDYETKSILINTLV